MKQPSLSDTIVYDSPFVTIGAFRCDRSHPEFRDTGPIRYDCFVFPRTAVRIEHEDSPPFVANPNIVTFYNRRQRYLRHEISERGDRCEWFAVRRDLAREAVRAIDPKVRDAPFRWHRGRCDPRTYLLQRRLFEGVASGAIRDSISVEESVLLLLDRVVGGAEAAFWGAKDSSVVHDVEYLLSNRFEETLTLPQIAEQVGISAYHLCRTFRAVTGYAVHQYIRQLRLRHGIERVCETSATLSRIAVDLGFAHHSHFTNAFRRDFEVTPCELRSSRSRC